MKDVNKVHLIGRLGGDPETRFTESGTARTTFSLATNRTYTTGDGQPRSETEWHRVTSWGKLAEICAQYLDKGARVYVEGRIRTSRWEDAETGEQRSGVEIVIHDLIMLDRPTPAVVVETDQEVGETQPTPRTPPPAPHPATHQPIRRPPEPVQLRDRSPHPSKRRRTDR